MSNIRGRGRGRGAMTSTITTHSQTQPSFQDDDDFDEQAHSARTNYSTQLALTKELFPNWSDEDILQAIQDANGDVNTTILRISEGHAQQWAGVTKKKVKKEQPTFTPAQSNNFPARGGFAHRGARGGFEGGRGGRGGARGGVAGRGGRGGAAINATPRAPFTNGAQPTNTNSSTPASFPPTTTSATPSAPAPATNLAVPKWGPSAPATPLAAEGSTTPQGWGDVAAASAASAKAPAASSEWGAATEASTTATVGWGDESPKPNGEDSHEDRPETPLAKVNEGWATAAAAAPPKAASKTIAPGSKVSWASIARPASPPKPTPPPPAPAPVAAPSPPAPVAAPAPVEPEQQTLAEEPAAPIINLPSPATATTAPASSETAPAATSTWNEAPASSLDPWGAATTPAPLAPGEGWADVVVAANEPLSHQPAAEVEAHLPPNDINAAGPIEVASSSSAPAAEESSSSSASAPAPSSSAAPEAATEQQDKSVGAGPPGFPPKRTAAAAANANANARPQQQEAVVLPGASSERPIDVQFGSLSLFDGQSSFNQEAPAKEAPQQQQAQGFSQEAPLQQYQQQQQQQQQQPEQHQAEQQHHAAQQEQGVQTSFSQPPPNLFNQQNAFSRYPGSSPYGQHQQHQQHHQQQQQHQQQQHQQHQQQQQQPEDHSAAAAPSPYAPFKPDNSVSSPYFQHPAAASHSPAPGQAPQAPQQSAYGAFNSVPQQTPGQPTPFASSQSDYSALYGQDALRNMGFYDAYGQGAPGNAFQNPSPLPRSDDPTSSASHTPAPVTPQPQAGQHQIPGQAQQHQQQPYGMMPYYSPYPFYQSYNPQAYQQVPPNYQALQQQYQQQQPYYGQQFGQQQQQQAAQATRSPYAPQPQSSPAGAYRTQPGGGAPANGQQQAYGQQQSQAPGAQASGQGYAGYAQPPREQRDYNANAKDLDRGFGYL